MTTLFLAAWLWLMASMNAHRLITGADFSYGVLRKLAGAAFILALFPLIVFPVMYAFARKYPSDWMHSFYREWAKVYTGYGKGGGGVNFFFEDISRLEITQTYLKNRPFFLTTINFKPTLNYLGKGRKERIGIGASNEEALRPLLDWAQLHGIEITFDRTDPSISSG